MGTGMKNFREDDGSKTLAPPAHPVSEVVVKKSVRPLLEASGDESSRDAWHPRIKRLYEYCKAIHPPLGLPGRQEFDPSAVPDLLPSLWMLDVQRQPFRLRYLLLGTSLPCSAHSAL